MTLVDQPELTVIHPGEGEGKDLGTIGVVFKLFGERTNGLVSIVEHPFPVGACVPPHLHTREDEYSIVTEGQIGFRSGDREVVLDLTRDCGDFVSGEGDGLLHVFVPHATAGIAILETGAGSDDDLLAALGDLLPPDDRWRHRHGSPGHGRSHVMPALVPPYATVPVLAGRLALGTWQSVCLVDLNVDNAVREVRYSFLAD